MILKLLGLLVQEEIFQEIHLTFLPVGHTHAEIDQRWSVLSRSMKGQDCLTLKDLKEHAHKVFTKSEKTCWFESYDVDEVADVSSVFNSENSHSFYGLAARVAADKSKRRLLCFRFRKGANGLPYVQVKEHDSPKDKWRGDWVKDEPLAIFKSTVPWDPSTLPAVPRQDLYGLEDLEKKISALNRFLQIGGHHEQPNADVVGRRLDMMTRFASAPAWWNEFLAEEKGWQALGRHSPELYTAWDLSLPKTHNDYTAIALLERFEAGEHVRSSEEGEDERRERLQHELPDHPYPIFLMHKNDRPPPHYRFDPCRDLNIGDVVLCLVDKVDSLFQRGWELAQIDLLVDTERVKVKWIQPRVRMRTGAWEGAWYERPLWSAWEDDDDGTECLVEWMDTVDRSCICWAGTLTKASKLRVRDQRIVCGQIAIIERTLGEVDVQTLATRLRNDELPVYPLDEVDEED